MDFIHDPPMTKVRDTRLVSEWDTDHAAEDGHQQYKRMSSIFCTPLAWHCSVGNENGLGPRRGFFFKKKSLIYYNQN